MEGFYAHQQRTQDNINHFVDQQQDSKFSLVEMVLTGVFFYAIFAGLRGIYRWSPGAFWGLMFALIFTVGFILF